MKWLLRLYPRAWRRRYGSEFLAMLETMRITPATVLDVVRGAIDAHVHPELGRECSWDGARGPMRFDRFSERARRALTLAQEEATALGHQWLGTEHVLLGLARERDESAGGDAWAVDAVALREEVLSIIGRGEPQAPELRLTPRTKRVLELAVKAAGGPGMPLVTPEHLLVGLLREGEGIAARILERFGVAAEDVTNWFTRRQR